jgi:hypothetical protein
MPALMPVQYQSVSVLDSFLRASPVELGVFSDQFATALGDDFAALPADPAAGDDLLSSFGLPLLLPPNAQIRAWEHILSVLKNADAAKYDKLHKGTAFYFLGVASYQAEDFERALFYMDCALEQDRSLHGALWYKQPSGCFVRLDHVSLAQAARRLVAHAGDVFQKWVGRLPSTGMGSFSLEAYRSQLVNYAMQADPALRSVVTAWLSYLLEAEPRVRQLELAPSFGSGEPFFLHLFKGGAILETLLKHSALGKPIVAANPGAQINHFMTNPAIFAALGFVTPPQGHGPKSFGDLIAAVKTDLATGQPFHLSAVRALWGIRNTTGHNIAWPQRPSVADYEQLFVLSLGAIALAITQLYPSTLLSDGTA